MLHHSQEDFCRLWGRLMAQAWDDPAFKAHLVADPAGVLAEYGYELPPGADVRLEVVAGAERTRYLYLPCEGELSENTAAAAGEVAGECVNNRVTLAQLAVGAKSAS